MMLIVHMGVFVIKFIVRVFMGVAVRRGSANIDVTVDGRNAYSTSLPNPIIRERLRPLEHVTVGRTDLPGIAGRFSGTIEHLPPSMPICRKLTRH